MRTLYALALATTLTACGGPTTLTEGEQRAVAEARGIVVPATSAAEASALSRADSLRTLPDSLLTPADVRWLMTHDRAASDARRAAQAQADERRSDETVGRAVGTMFGIGAAFAVVGGLIFYALSRGSN